VEDLFLLMVTSVFLAGYQKQVAPAYYQLSKQVAPAYYQLSKQVSPAFGNQLKKHWW
jgi:hypothetical protein